MVFEKTFKSIIKRRAKKSVAYLESQYSRNNWPAGYYLDPNSYNIIKITENDGTHHYEVVFKKSIEEKTQED